MRLRFSQGMLMNGRLSGYRRFADKPQMWSLLLASLLILLGGLASDSLVATPKLHTHEGNSGDLAIGWQDASHRWALEMSNDLNSWALIDPREYEESGPPDFRFLRSPVELAQYFRLRKLGEASFYVVGDSISTRGEWPASLEALTGRVTFSQAIGGTKSTSMVNRARGVELLYPKEGSDTIAPGPVTVRWGRHVADRTQLSSYRSAWAGLAKSVSEPRSIEVYEHGRLIGFAERELMTCSTDYANGPKTIFCEAHGLQAGDHVTFISSDPGYPEDLSVRDSSETWGFSSSALPSAIVERRVYHAANVTPDSFEIRESESSFQTLDIGSDVQAGVFIETGWKFNWNYTGGDWGLTWKARTKYDDWIWLLEVSANDIPGLRAEAVTIPNTEKLLEQLTEIDERFLIVCPPSGSYPTRGPGSFNWINYYETYMPYVRTHFPDRHIDTMALMSQYRTAEEFAMLDDPGVPQLLWIQGTPSDPRSWEKLASTAPGATNTWVGPGYTPLQFRASFADRIHLHSTANELLAVAIAARIVENGW